MAKKAKASTAPTIEALFINPLDGTKEKDAMKHPDYRAPERIMSHLEAAPKTRRIVWAALFVVVGWRLPEIITAIRWW